MNMMKEGDVDESRERHDQGEEQRPDSFGAFDESKNPTDLGHSHLI